MPNWKVAECNCWAIGSGRVQLLGSWKPNVPYGPDGRMAAVCLPDGVFPLLFPDGAPTATHLDFQSIWPKSHEIWTNPAKITKSQHVEIWGCQF